MRVKTVISFTLEYEINKEFYPGCKTTEDFIEYDKWLLEQDFYPLINSEDSKMNIKIKEVNG